MTDSELRATVIAMAEELLKLRQVVEEYRQALLLIERGQLSKTQMVSIANDVLYELAES